MKKIKTWIYANKFDLLIWGFSLVALTLVLRPLLVDRITPGWDTTPHYYLFTKMVEYLKMGRISGYDNLWFAGFPAFRLYGPLPYILMAVPYFASFGKIGMALSFNLFLFFLPFLFLLSMWYTARVWFGKSGGYVSMIFANIFLCAVQDKAGMGVGIQSIISIGLFSSFFAICLMIFFLGIIEKHRRKPQIANLSFGSLILAALILTHAMTLLFTLLVLGIYTLINWKKFWKSSLAMGLAAVILSSFWLIPFLKDLYLSSGIKLGLWGAVNDPLFVLYDFPSYFGEHGVSLAISIIPTILLLVCSITGIILSVKEKNSFWGLAFLLTLIILPREYLTSYFNLPVHYYRYTAHIYVLNIFLATGGFLFLLKKTSGLKHVAGQVSKGLLAGIAIAVLIINYGDALNLSDNPRSYVHKYDFAAYSKNAEAEKVMAYLEGLNIKNRVAVPSMPEYQETLGSPHFFSTFLPLKYKIAVVPGLLAESAISTQFVLPVVANLAASLSWGNTSLQGDVNFRNQDKDSMIQRLGLYNVQYLLTTSGEAVNLKNVDKKLLSEKNRIGDFVIFELKNYSPLIEATNYRPFLFVNKGGVGFLDFSKEWFKQPKLFEMPVIYTKKALADLPKTETDQMSGFIMSMPSGSEISKDTYDEWLKIGKKIVFLNAAPDKNLEEFIQKNGVSDNIEFIKYFNNDIGGDILARTLMNSKKEVISRKAIEPELISEMEIKFNNQGGTLINYSYFPDWKVDDSTTIYWATPTMMWVFGKGEVSFKY